MNDIRKYITIVEKSSKTNALLEDDSDSQAKNSGTIPYSEFYDNLKEGLIRALEQRNGVLGKSAGQQYFRYTDAKNRFVHRSAEDGVWVFYLTDRQILLARHYIDNKLVFEKDFRDNELLGEIPDKPDDYNYNYLPVFETEILAVRLLKSVAQNRGYFWNDKQSRALNYKTQGKPVVWKTTHHGKPVVWDIFFDVTGVLEVYLNGYFWWKRGDEPKVYTKIDRDLITMPYDEKTYRRSIEPHRTIYKS